jgi:hypothetical protein
LRAPSLLAQWNDMRWSSMRAGRFLAVVTMSGLLWPACGSGGNPAGGGRTPPTADVDADSSTSPTGGAGGSKTGGGTGGSPGDAGAGGQGASPPAPAADAGADTGLAPPIDGAVIMPPPASGDDTLPPCKRDVPVATSAALAMALSAAQPGDCIALADGSYTFPTITTKATEAAPVVVRAVNPLKAIVSSGNLIMQGAAYVVVEGILWNGNGLIRLTDTDHGRISRFRLQRMETAADLQNHDLAWITVFGASSYCRIDHCDFGPQNQRGNMILTTGTETTPLMATHTRIDHNHFHDVHFAGGNGWETIRSGADTLSYGSSFTVIEHNLFDHDNNDPEVVSLKSSDNTVRYNTMRASKGQFSIRSGNRCAFYGNYVLGDGVAGALGVRIGGSGHQIYDNYVEGVSGPGIFLEGGDIDEPTGTLPVPCTAAQCDPRMRVTTTEVVFNTVVNAGGITLGGGGHPLDPNDCTVAYNVVQGPGSLYVKGGGTNVTFTGNIGFMGTNSAGAGVMMIDPVLKKIGEVFAIGAGSPAIDAGKPSFPYVTLDIAGIDRDAMPDVGANEVSMQTPKFGLLGPNDVGPMAP